MLTIILLMGTALADCAPVDLATANRAARRTLDDQDPSKALVIVARAEAGLPCLDVLVRRDDLAELYQVGGTAAMKSGDQAEAQRLFTAGARMAGQIPFDVRIGEDAAAQYASARAFVETNPRGSVLAWTPARIDGLDVPIGEAQSVPQGAHLIQQVRPDGSVRSAIEVVAEGATVEIGTAPVAPTPAPSRERHLGRSIGGAGLVLAGSTALVLSGVMKNSLSGYEDGEEPISTINALTFGGGAAVGIGTAVLFTGSIQTSSLAIQPLAVFTGRF